MKLFRRQRRRDLAVALGTAGAIAIGGLAVLPAGSANAATGCAVTYTASSWNGGFSTNITIKNLGEAVSGWTLGFTFPSAGQKIGQGWSATYAQSGTAVTAQNVGYNASLSTGGSTGIGFNGTWTDSNPTPAAFTLNGVTCTGTTTPGTTPTATASATATATPSATPTATASPTASPTVSPTASPPASPPPTSTAPVATTPAGINGLLHVCGVNLCNQYNRAIQLRGMSTHGLQWFAQCYNDASLDVLAQDWKADLLRISMYVQEDGYETDPSGFTAQVNGLVDKAEARGLYALVDFHTLTPGDPNYNLARAKTFFAAVAARNASKTNVIYEIANEPNGVSWAGIKSYAEQVIPVIRAADPDAVVIVGTRGWSSLGVSDGSSESEIVSSPVNATNIMYAFHFYAASHKDNYRTTVSRAASQLPLFVSEFGTVSASGDGAVDTASTTAWLDLLDQLKISYANWTYSDAEEGSAAFKPGTCNSSTYSAYAGTAPLNPSGILVRSRIMTADVFPTS